MRPDRNVRWVLDSLERDVGARVAQADHENGTVLEVGRVVVVVECSWRIAGSSWAAKSGVFGLENGPVATTTWFARKRRWPAVTR